MTDCISKRSESDEPTITLDEEEIERGKNGAVVRIGRYCFRNNVAIKLIQMKNYEAFIREVKILSNVDPHTNIISHYGHGKYKNCCYIALEKCDCTLRDFVFVQTKFMFQQKDLQSETKNEMKRKKFQHIKDFCQHNGIEMWNKKKFPVRIPTDHTLKLLRAILHGISALHEQNIYHRDLTPENILLKFDKNHVCVRICDFNISKPIIYDRDFNYNNIGDETRGWKAPNQIKGKEIDTFNFGCIIFFCLTGGDHPFGHFSTRQNGMKIGQHDISAISHIPEAFDIVNSLIRASQRPGLHDIEVHPFFWISKKRIHFLHIASDRVELEKRTTNTKHSAIMRGFNNAEGQVVPGSWDSIIDKMIISHINLQRGHAYGFNDLCELLRAFRNLHCHYIDHPQDIQAFFDSRPDGVLEYFQDNFPDLFFEVFKIIMRSPCVKEDAFNDFVK